MKYQDRLDLIAHKLTELDDEFSNLRGELPQPIVDEEAWIRETVDAMAGKVDDAFQSHLRNILRERLPLLKGEK